MYALVIALRQRAAERDREVRGLTVTFASSLSLALLGRPTVCVSLPRGGHSPIGSGSFLIRSCRDVSQCRVANEEAVGLEYSCPLLDHVVAGGTECTVIEKPDRALPK